MDGVQPSVMAKLCSIAASLPHQLVVPMSFCCLSRYDPAAAAHRREAAAKLLTSMVQRDADARRHLIINGCLKQVLGLLNPRVSLVKTYDRNVDYSTQFGKGL